VPLWEPETVLEVPETVRFNPSLSVEGDMFFLSTAAKSRRNHGMVAAEFGSLVRFICSWFESGYPSSSP